MFFMNILGIIMTSKSGDFAERDLLEANSLSQIKWMYDGSKISSLNKTQILNLIENVNIPQTTINKYFSDGLLHSKSELVDLIDGKFNDIFKVINL